MYLPGCIYQDLVHTAHTDVDWIQHQANGLVHQPPEPKLW